MFLRPHHFQTAQRHWFHQSYLDEKWDHHYNWGLRSMELDPTGLANYRFVVRSLKARLRDGTLVSVPEDGSLPVVDLKSAFERNTTVKIFLAVPVMNLGRANVSVNGAAEAGRYFLDTQDLEDENTGINPQQIQVRLLNLKLLSTQDHAGYEVLPIARIEKSARAEATPQLDVGYIPPLLACDGWEPLKAGILEQVFDRIGKKQHMLGQLIVTRGISMESQSQGDRLILEQLRVLNEASALLGIMAFAQGVHPLTAYLELARLVGQLAIFNRKIGPQTPSLPKYDHDDLGGCFYRLKHYLDGLLDIEEPDYKERPFIGQALRMQVTMDGEWIHPGIELFVGVKSPLRPNDCVQMLTRPGILDMKIGSADRVDDIFRLGRRGLEFAHCPVPPRVLPTQQGLHYFQVNRASQQEEWGYVQQSLTLAIRMNENRIDGNIDGQKVLRIRTGKDNTTMEFTLYVVAPKK
jgi:type VI secretion system protein ImpJ